MTVRDELRVAEERVATLRRENEVLRGRNMKPKDLGGYVLAAVLAAALAGAAAFTIARGAVERQATREGELAAHERAIAVLRQDAVTQLCEASVQTASADLASCRKALARPRQLGEAAPLPYGPPSGDPLECPDCR